MQQAAVNQAGNVKDGAGTFALTGGQPNWEMVADPIQNVFGQRKFKFHAADPATGKREVREIGG